MKIQLSKIVVLGALICATLGAGSAFAAPRERGQRGGRGGEMGARIAEKLGLTADQKARIQSITEGAKSQAKAIQGDASLSQEQKRARLQELRSSVKSQIEAVLTPEQRAQIAALKEKAQAGRGQGGGRRQRGGRRGGRGATSAGQTF